VYWYERHRSTNFSKKLLSEQILHIAKDIRSWGLAAQISRPPLPRISLPDPERSAASRVYRWDGLSDIAG
jgi:hypothetical protein